MSNDLTILIDTDSMVFVKATETVRQAEYWSELAIPDRNFHIVGLKAKHFSCFNLYELSQLYYNTTGVNPQEKVEYATLVQGCLELARNMVPDDKTESVLRMLLGWEITDDYKSPALPEKRTKKRQSGEVKPKRTSSDPNAPVKRPKEGSATGKVWELADEAIASNSAATRPEIIALCEQNGINKSTASVQLSKWNKWREQKGST